MKKEHAEDSWEKMAALRDGRRAQGHTPQPHTRAPPEHRPHPGAEGVELRSQDGVGGPTPA